MQNILDDLISELNNISSVEKLVIQGKMNMNTTYCYKIKLRSKNSYRQRKTTSSIKKNANKPCDDCIIFHVQDKLPNGHLPTGKQVLGYLFYNST